MLKNILKIRLLLWLVLISVTSYILYLSVVPHGEITYTYDFSKPDKHIKELRPKERLETIFEKSQKIINDPVYFFLYTPRKFASAKLSLKYRRGGMMNDDKLENNFLATNPVLEAGILVDKTNWHYQLKPIENSIIDALAMRWKVVVDNDLILLQKQSSMESENIPQIKLFNNVNNFLENLPARNKIALYNYEIKKDFLLEEEKNYKNEIVNFSTSTFPNLKGSYQFFTYLNSSITASSTKTSEKLNFKFIFIDLNQENDSDFIDLNIYRNNELVETKHLNDDGIITDSREESVERELNIELADLPIGIYKVEFKASNDIITKNIITSQNKLAFIDKIWLRNSQQTNLKIYTDIKDLRVQTVNPDSLQTIQIREKKFEINETYKQFSIPINAAEYALINLEKDGLILAGNGVFSFAENYLINPKFKKLNKNFNSNDVDYILANYKLPQEKGKWQFAEIEFDLKKAHYEPNPRQLGNTGKYSFVISIPNLNFDKQIKNWIEVDEISVVLFK